jgi:hypothetical protein
VGARHFLLAALVLVNMHGTCRLPAKGLFVVVFFGFLALAKAKKAAI